MTVLPHLGNMKHSPKVHIKRPTNKQSYVTVVAAQAREDLFWEAAEDVLLVSREYWWSSRAQKCQAGQWDRHPAASEGRWVSGSQPGGASCTVLAPAGLCSLAGSCRSSVKG